MSMDSRGVPHAPQMYRAEVVRSRRLSPSYQRVTVTGLELEAFAYVGLDQWFRLFLPTADGQLRLPMVQGRTWWQPYLAIPEEVRPHCSNYTVAEFRREQTGGEMDIDVVLHWDSAGELCGTVATWATTAEPGSQVGLLDQGVLFDPPEDTSELILVADETGLPALRGILRDLPPTARGRVIIEVPHIEDAEAWSVPAEVAVTWLPRRHSDRVPGRLALAALREGATPSEYAYGFVVGESTLATEGRRWLVKSGLAKERIFFSGFWRRDRGAENRPS